MSWWSERLSWGWENVVFKSFWAFYIEGAPYIYIDTCTFSLFLVCVSKIYIGEG